MRTKLKLNPGERGTRKLLQKYGDRLVCVRYRYDKKRCSRKERAPEASGTEISRSRNYT